MNEVRKNPMEAMSLGLQKFINKKGDNVDKQTKALVKNIYHIVLDKKERD